MTDLQWTVEKQIAYPLIGETAIAPDGRFVAYTVREPLLKDEESKFIHHLYLVETESGARRQLTFGEHSNVQPRWSPDGRYLAFLSNRAGQNNLYCLRIDGGEAWALTRFEKGPVGGFRWSPDGRRLALLRPDPPTEEKEKARKAKDDPLLWDEEHDYVHLWMVPFAVGPRELPEVVRVTTGRFHIVGLDWFPDGTRLAITHQATPVVDTWTETRLATVPAEPLAADKPFDEPGLTDVGLLAAWFAQPWVSPDGQWIAAIVGEQPARWAFAALPTLFPVGAGEPRTLSQTPDAQVTLLGWAADGKALFGLEAIGFDSQLIMIPTDGSPAVVITSSATLKQAPSLSRSGQLVYAAQSFHEPNHVTRFDPRTGDERPIAAVDLPEAWPAALPRADVRRWDAPDGLEIEGAVVYPLDFEPGRRYPLVVEVHGGPQGVFSRNYLAGLTRYGDVAALAERGYFVLRVNPRGSSGYGRDFRFANYGDWGEGDYEDIMAGVELLIAEGLVDPARLGIMGWSYGGYMSSRVITKTDRFGAACVGAGVTNLMTMNGTADIASFIPEYFGGEYWDDLEPYVNHSPMFQVRGVTTPTLIQHGQEDTRVPLSQGRELYNALKRQGVPVRLVIYPRQGHGIDEPRLRMDMARRPVQWFERWLKDEPPADGSSR